MNTVVRYVLVVIVVVVVVYGIGRTFASLGDVPTVFKSNSTGEIHMMTIESYPNYIYGVQEEDLPSKYNLIWVK